jgi:hypothetical protein
VQLALSPEWHWTADEYNASYAWNCNFDNGYQDNHHKCYDGAAVAVRLIPIPKTPEEALVAAAGADA